jgi:hypothetical protein
MRLLLGLFLILLTTGVSNAERLWINTISVNDTGMTWNYNETITGMEAIIYRINLDRELGDNDSFINAWELLNADKEIRKTLRSSIDNEQDVKINNETSGVAVVEVYSTLSPEIIGKTNSSETITNEYSVSYRFKESILNAKSIWFLGQAKSPVTFIMPVGVDVVNANGIDNFKKNITDHEEIMGSFKDLNKDRGEIILYLAKNASYRIPEMNVSNVSSTPNNTNKTTKPLNDVLTTIRNISIVVLGAIIILLIYVFKVLRR